MAPMQPRLVIAAWSSFLTSVALLQLILSLKMHGYISSLGCRVLVQSRCKAGVRWDGFSNTFSRTRKLNQESTWGQNNCVFKHFNWVTRARTWKWGIATSRWKHPKRNWEAENSLGEKKRVLTPRRSEAINKRDKRNSSEIKFLNVTFSISLPPRYE